MNVKQHHWNRRNTRKFLNRSIPVKQEDYRAYRTCYNKRFFETEEQAIHGAIKASMKYGPCRVYKCPECGHYHLTTQVDVYTAAWAEEHPDQVYATEPQAIECKISVNEEVVEPKDDGCSYHLIELEAAEPLIKKGKIDLLGLPEYDTSIFTADYPKAG